MLPQIDIVDPITGASPTWSVYLLALADGTAFKVGFSAHPLQRISSFSARYFERFDLPQCRLLSVANAARARALELELKHLLAEQRIEPPTWVPAEAGGHTEWFAIDRLDAARTHLDARAAPGAVSFELDARLASELRRMTAQFEPWAWSRAREITEAWDAAYGGWPAPIDAARSLRDWIDAFRYFEIDLFVDDRQVREFVFAAAHRRQ